MNKLEDAFYTEFLSWQYMIHEMPELKTHKDIHSQIKPQHRIGNYVADFLVFHRIVVEVDGHDYHKTKEQREYDYKKTRYLQKKGYTVVRFTGTEVFLDPVGCWREVKDILYKLLSGEIDE
jgi:very-short-patch-repair endonuclease